MPDDGHSLKSGIQTLSSKIHKAIEDYGGSLVIRDEDVKTFIKQLKDMIVRHYSLNNKTRLRLSLLERIDKLAGPQLLK